MGAVEPEAEGASTRVLVVFGIGLWLCAGVCAVWEALALQSPVSPFHLGVLVGPITQLRNACFVFGTGSLVLGQAWARWFADGGTLALGCLVGGAGAQLLALVYAAYEGLWAVQLHDPRGDARALVWVRLIAHGLVLLGLGLVAARTWRRRR